MGTHPLAVVRVLGGLAQFLYGCFQSDTFWVAVGAIVSAGVAIATFKLAKLTKRLADETAKSIQLSQATNELADKHHQEGLTPMIIAAATLRLHTSTQDQILATGEKGSEITTQSFVLNGTIENIGPGPAVNISILVKPENHKLVTFTLVPMAGACSRPLLCSWTNILIEKVDRASILTPYSIKISYLSSFETQGMTNQISFSGKSEDLFQGEGGYRPKPKRRSDT